MILTKILREIQYQTAKLEIIELLSWYWKNNEPSLDTEMAYNMIFTLRQNLFNASEACLEAPLEEMQLHISPLRDTLISATNFLSQMNSGLNSSEMQVVFLKELFTSIVSELVNLNARLADAISESSQQSFYKNSSIATKPKESVYQQPLVDSDDSVANQNFKKLINKCMGDAEKAERLIQFECQRNSKLDREAAILSAITRWERDNY